MAKVQISHLSGKIMEGASWEVGEVSLISEGEIVRLNIPVSEPKLAKFLAKSQAPECTLEDEDRGKSVTVGLMVEKFTHFMSVQDDAARMELIVWLKPMNRTVEGVLALMFDREACDSRFLAMVGVPKPKKRRQKETEETETEETETEETETEEA